MLTHQEERGRIQWGDRASGDARDGAVPAPATVAPLREYLRSALKLALQN